MNDHNHDHSNFVTTREFDRAIASIANALAEGFAGVHGRLDKLNGQTEKNNSAIQTLRPIVSEQSAKIANLNREVFDRPYRQPSVHAQEPSDPDKKPITRRDLNVAIGTGVILVSAIVWLFMQFGPFVADGNTIRSTPTAASETR